MSNDKTIDELLTELDQAIAWFHSDEFRLETARERFLAVKQIADQAEKQLLAMKNEIDLLSAE